MIRRVLSIVLFVLAGIFLMSLAVVAFVTPTPDVSKPAMLGSMSPFVLVPLLLGAWASPGARLREVGIVLLASAGWAGFSVGSIVYMLAMPDTRKQFPPETLEALHTFSDYWVGGGLLLLLAAAGGALVYHGGGRKPSGAA